MTETKSETKVETKAAKLPADITTSEKGVREFLNVWKVPTAPGSYREMMRKLAVPTVEAAIEARNHILEHAKILHTPGSLPLYAETKSSLASLVGMAKLGYVTTNSQEGIVSFSKPTLVDSVAIAKSIDALKYYEDDPDNESEDDEPDCVLENEDGKSEDGKSDENDDGKSNIWDAHLCKEYEKRGGVVLPCEAVSSSERAYLTGLMPSVLADMFVHYMGKTSMIAFIPGCSIPVTYGRANTINKNLYSIMPIETLPRCTGLPTEPTAENKLGDGAAWEWSEVFDSEYRGGFVEVNCMDPVHGRLASGKDGLYPLVISVLEQCWKVLDDFREKNRGKQVSTLTS